MCFSKAKYVSYIFTVAVSPCTLPANSLMKNLAHIWVIMNIGCTFIERLENQAQRTDGNPGELGTALGTVSFDLPFWQKSWTLLFFVSGLSMFLLPLWIISQIVLHLCTTPLRSSRVQEVDIPISWLTRPRLVTGCCPSIWGRQRRRGVGSVVWKSVPPCSCSDFLFYPLLLYRKGIQMLLSEWWYMFNQEWWVMNLGFWTNK